MAERRDDFAIAIAREAAKPLKTARGEADRAVATTGDRAAAFYTLIGNCHRAGIDAQAYLTDLFTRLPLPTVTTKTLGALTPHGWAAAHQAAAENPET